MKKKEKMLTNTDSMKPGCPEITGEIKCKQQGVANFLKIKSIKIKMSDTLTLTHGFT